MGIKEELKPVPTSVVHSSTHTHTHTHTHTLSLSQGREDIGANKLFSSSLFLFFPLLLASFSVLHLLHSVLNHPCCALLVFPVLPQLKEDMKEDMRIHTNVRKLVSHVSLFSLHFYCSQESLNLLS